MGQVRWPKGPPHLALNPPCFIVFVFFGGGGLAFFSFLCLVLMENMFSPQKGHLCLFFSVSPSFSLSLFSFPFFTFSFSVSLFFFSFFLPSFLSCFFFFWFLVLSVYLFFLFLCFSYMKSTTSNIKVQSLFFNVPFCFLVFCLLFLSNPFSLSLFFFLILSFVYGST